MAYPNLALAPDRTVFENIFLGRELPRRGLLSALRMLDRSAMDAEALDALARLAIRTIKPIALVSKHARSAFDPAPFVKEQLEAIAA